MTKGGTYKIVIISSTSIIVLFLGYFVGNYGFSLLYDFDGSSSSGLDSISESEVIEESDSSGESSMLIGFGDSCCEQGYQWNPETEICEPICGDGIIIQPPEACDPGSDLPNYGCNEGLECVTITCALCQCQTPCEEGQIRNTETCQCEDNLYCGDGIITPPEECEDDSDCSDGLTGGTCNDQCMCESEDECECEGDGDCPEGQYCSDCQCTQPFCGNGVVESGEDCDGTPCGEGESCVACQCQGDNDDTNYQPFPGWFRCIWPWCNPGGSGGPGGGDDGGGDGGGGEYCWECEGDNGVIHTCQTSESNAGACITGQLLPPECEIEDNWQEVEC